MEDDGEKSQKIQIVAFTTNEKTNCPNDILLNYLNNNSHYIIKKNKQLIAFSTVLPDQKKPTKIMLCTVFDLSLEYEGINEVNCYIIVIDLHKESTKEKYAEILAYIEKYCDLSKKIYILGVKNEEEGDKLKITEKEIGKIADINVDYEYYKCNLDNKIDISDKIMEIFKNCLGNSLNEDNGKIEGDSRSCSIY